MTIWEEIEEKLMAAESRQRERDGKCDDERGNFIRWLLRKFAESQGIEPEFYE